MNPNMNFQKSTLSIKTKKYKLESSTYIKLGMMEVLKQYWYFLLIPLLLIIPAFIWPGGAVWFIVGAVVLYILYFLFWLIQFAGVTQLPQNKPMFEKMSYEIDNRFILMKLNAKQGMQMPWDQIKKGEKLKDAYLLTISKAQFIHLPFSIFNSDNDLRFTEALLKRKKLIQ